ncbi:MAG: 3-deoxy-7-phosphoheptulonate synthase [Bacteroidetes Order II. Incertae sedis bacterium]|jgi:3-deoxy-7-phosphoheptulonate synthase|nr:3-deoxy-7-phosphoheptulonate synthase [Bacteroidetes Order II. bacterium]MDG1754444.1 3-deoxy-7-phosphoheptulonate synthase [Rhodothermales bacterium]HAY36540.1 3-deoxy-7-phosphoheptulonate synthase [Bacteroidota bacterium]MBT6424139.1 3-deoxy-7-phosphoheptulonate synthase [Bacteroidetes Order II. bacterium]MBT6598068.1 3-deoxy-7-phosphoheptulonate synthase [Bacteroidetes Order II. bacterium]
MIVVMNSNAVEAQVEAVIAALNDHGFDVHRSSGSRQTILGAIGVKPEFDPRHLQLLDGVAEVHRVTEPYKFASRSWKAENTVVHVGDVAVGGDMVVVMAGPCSVESEEQIEASAAHVASCGVQVLRGGAFKPRSSPYSFQGLGEDGLRMMRAAADRNGLKVVTEMMDMAHANLMVKYADIIQIGARNMQNFPLLRLAGQTGLPVLLKRGMSATIKEWLMSAEYILAENNPNVILCERGIRTFENYTRNTLDLSAVPVIKALSHLPIIVDPSHGVGIRDKVLPMARAGIAAGADGLMIEVHPNPADALSDGPQSLPFAPFSELMNQVGQIASVIGRTSGSSVQSI